MRRLTLDALIMCTALVASVSSAIAQGDDSIYGTHSVTFQSIQVGGDLQGCTLVYRAVQADYAYLGGNAVVIVGNIGVGQFNRNLILTLKIGVKNLAENQPFVRPNFAYLQTKTKSTANAKQQARDGEEGFRLIAYSLYDPSVMDLYKEIIDSGRVTVGFNRKKGGMDVLVPIELDVIDSEYSGGDKVIRKRSKETESSFLDCVSTLVKQAESSLDKK